MSNSSLISYSKISPNKSAPRNHKIDTISIHCMAGNLTIESCGNLFAKSSTKASSNYGIGSDGRIGMYVEEKDRSWCTSNSANDNRAITIEVANDSGADTGWHVSDKAMESLVSLLVDVCQRNGIKELLWKGDKSLIGQVNKQNMTVHRWFAKKSCPGDYLYNKHGWIAAEVNKRLGTTVTVQPIKLQNEPKSKNYSQVIWDKLKEAGFTDIATAGIMGNLHAESGLKPDNLQNSYEKTLGSDTEYTNKVNNKTYSKDSFVHDKAGYGLAQWTYWSRKQGLYEFTIEQGFNIDDLEKQAEYLIQELTTNYKGITSKINKVKTVREASNIILFEFEKPANQGASVQNTRFEYSYGFYKLYAK